VTLFFTLSGFLLYRGIAAALLHDRDLPATGAYLRNRALRILPAYWAILAVCGLVLGSVNVRDEDGALTSGALTEPLELLGAALLVNNYRPDTVLVGIGPAWSLAVEAVFYLILPVLGAIAAAVAARLPEARRRLVVLGPPVFLLALGLSGKLVAGSVVQAGAGEGWGPTWHAVVERSFWAQADLFAFGMLLAVVHVATEDGRLRVGERARRFGVAAALLLLAACAVSLRGDQLSYRPANTVAALACALLVAAVVLPRASGEPSAWARRLAARPLVALGAASYSLFLWHEPLVHWLAGRGLTAGGWSGLALNVVLVLAVAGVLSALTYRLIEMPVLRRRRTSYRVTRTQSTSMVAGNAVVASGDPGQAPPTARLRSTKNGCPSNAQVRVEARSAGVNAPYGRPSSENMTTPGSHVAA
jgi:peptidoglycan/LPS O-acetylase OafA/YrhL